MKYCNPRDNLQDASSYYFMENGWIPPDAPLFKSRPDFPIQIPGLLGSLLGLAAASDCAWPGV